MKHLSHLSTNILLVSIVRSSMLMPILGSCALSANEQPRTTNPVDSLNHNAIQYRHNLLRRLHGKSSRSKSGKSSKPKSSGHQNAQIIYLDSNEVKNPYIIYVSEDERHRSGKSSKSKGSQHTYLRIEPKSNLSNATNTNSTNSTITNSTNSTNTPNSNSTTSPTATNQSALTSYLLANSSDPVAASIGVSRARSARDNVGIRLALVACTISTWLL
eukprot:CCRYP_019206-RA/>CCRYP_019206-RA protein AED:0.06 eAED:0.06 QI:47/1/1/1/1/1/3/207/215